MAKGKRLTEATGARSATGSYPSFLYTCGYSVRRLVGDSSRIDPSGGDDFSAWMARRAPAPVRFSTTAVSAKRLRSPSV